MANKQFIISVNLGSEMYRKLAEMAANSGTSSPNLAAKYILIQALSNDATRDQFASAFNRILLVTRNLMMQEFPKFLEEVTERALAEENNVSPEDI